MEPAIPGPRSTSLVASVAEDDGFNPSLCIICQEDNKSRLTSEDTGRARVKRAAEIRNDTVTQRIRRLDDKNDDDNGMFVYHNTNKCYKSYTHSGKLKAIEEKRSEEPMECETDNEASTSAGFRKSLRSSVLPCAPPSCQNDPRTLLCAICGNVEHKRNRDKYRICEYGSAKKLIDAAKHFQDDVFTRVADRLSDNEDNSIKSVISADLYCHNTCRQNYLRQYERDIKCDVPEKPAIINIKRVLFNRTLPYIDNLLAKGECCTVSDIVEFASSLLEEDEVLTSTFQNRDMKQLIISHYGQSVTISPNSRVNDSDFIFSSDISAADLAIKLKNQDIMREAGTQLRKVLKDVDFGLQDSFCDSTDLKSSWEGTIMPAPLRTFLAALFKVPKYKLFKSSAHDLEELLQPLKDEEDEPAEEQLLHLPIPTQGEPPSQEQTENWVRDHKSTQLYCLFQMLV